MKIKRKDLVILAAMFVIAACLFSFIMPKTAWGRTLVDYDAMIATEEAKLDKKQTELAEKQALLAETVKTAYKDYSAQDFLTVISSEDKFLDAIKQFEYINQLTNYYKRTVQEIQDAKIVIEETIIELDNLRAERQSRAMSADKAALIQYSQSGESWSSLPYWGVSISYAGCGLCAYTSIIDILTDEEYTPADMLEMRGDWQGMDHWVDDNTGTPDGSTHREWTKKNFGIDMYRINASTSDLAEVLENGDGETAVMLLAHDVAFKKKSGGRWWSSGHFVCVFKYDEDGFHVHDSASSHDEGNDVVYSWDEMDDLMYGTTHLIVYENI